MGSDRYQLVTVTGGKEDADAILAILAGIKKGDFSDDLRLLNYYREVPVSYAATIDEIDGDHVYLTVNSLQALVMQNERMTFLRSEHLPHEVVAIVERADSNRSIAIVTKFAYAILRADRRRFVRIKVDEPLPCRVVTPNGAFAGQVADISLGGLAIVSASPCRLEANETGTLTIKLLGIPLELPVVVIKISTVDEGTRCVLQLNATVRDEQLVANYISQKQMEIIKELKEQF